jgi:UDP-N-acetylglucosamine 2-epimerase (non-hydrolysing)
VTVTPENPVTIVHVIDTRSSVVALAPIVRSLERRTVFRQVIVHTGRRWDTHGWDRLFALLGSPPCDRFLAAPQRTSGVSTARVLSAFERLLMEERPVVVVLAGHDDTILACALAAAKLSVAVARVEAGLRSRDGAAPDEINRVLTDRLSDVLFTQSPEGLENLIAEGIGAERVYHVGNTRIDSLRRCERAAHDRRAWEALGLGCGEYVLVTPRRRRNVSVSKRASAIASAVSGLARECAVVFAVHPRMAHHLQHSGALDRLADAGVRCVDVQDYVEFLSLASGAGAVLTDSGPVQEETAVLGVTCFMLSASTERPAMLSHGGNVLLGDDPAEILHVRPSGRLPTPSAVPLWDGRAAERVADALEANYALRRESLPRD